MIITKKSSVENNSHNRLTDKQWFSHKLSQK